MKMMYVFRAMATLWTLAIMALCWLPMDSIPKQGGSGFWLFDLPFFDKIVHFGIFAVFAVFWSMAAPGPAHAKKILAGGVVLAVLTEVVQMLPAIGRQSDLDDGLCDVAGVLVGLGAMAFVFGYLTRRSAGRLARSSA
jgi:hypothetical protein